MTPNHYLKQCWLILKGVAWRHQAINSINVDLSSNVFCGIYLRAISLELLLNWIHIMWSDITLCKLLPHFPEVNGLTHWGRVTHICVSKQTIIGSDNGLSPGRRQSIIWTNAGTLLIGPLGTNFSEILIEIYIFSFKKMYLKMSLGNWQPFCLGLNVLIYLILPELSVVDLGQ